MKKFNWILSDHRKIYILLSVDRYSKWPAACLTNSPNGTTAAKFLERYIKLKGVPKLILTDQGTEFTGRVFRQFFKKYFRIIYVTPFLHTSTGLVERGVRTLKNYMLANINEGQKISTALDSALETMKTTVHSKEKKSAVELHMGRKPRLEIHIYLNVDSIIQHRLVLEKPDTIPIYSFGRSGDETDQLIIKAPRKSKRTVSNEYRFSFVEKKLVKRKFECPYQEKTQVAIDGTKHPITTADGKVIHRKRISNPSRVFQEGPSQRGMNPRDQKGRWMRPEMTDYRHDMPGPSRRRTPSPTYSPPITLKLESMPIEIQVDRPEDNGGTRLTATVTTGTKPNGIGRGYRRKLVKDRMSTTTSPEIPSPTNLEHDERPQLSDWSVNASNMMCPLSEEIRREIKDNAENVTILETQGNMNSNNSVKIEGENGGVGK